MSKPGRTPRMPLAAAPLFVVALTTGLGSPGRGDEPPSYNRDIRPILAENCFACHGADSASRKAELRLDRREEAIELAAIIPGRPDESELIARISADDPDLHMPPPETKKNLTAAQQEQLKRWIAAGAVYQPHWSLIKPQKPQPPSLDDEAWVKNPIDQFVGAELAANGLSPAAEADARTLFRRLHLDITGLPPSPEDVTAFAGEYAHRSHDALSKWIDRLMGTSAWGEHRARYWLDAARYADTHGLHFDNYREMWPYRDWVILAFNANLPFDQFTVEQLAGDLLPDPSDDQLIATGLQRCNMTTDEGGTIPEENLANYAADRVQTFGWVFLGLTTNCGQCHDHKFDSFTMKDFYSLAAFFRNTTQGAMDGNEKDGQGPALVVPAAEDRLRWMALPGEIAAAIARRDVAHDTEYPRLEKAIADLESERDAIQERSPITHIQQENKDSPAMAFILMRGAYDKPGDKVAAATPAALHPLPAGAPHNRLGLARWVVDPDNPLTARVTVNRFWQEVFGQGIVATPEDFGVMGAPPSHPELLDWLAVEFRESGCDVKRLFKLMLTSATYRQAAITTLEKLEKDRDNALVSRGPRFRMDAEMVRDHALAVSGLLSSKMYGPGTKPYQPVDIWNMVGLPEGNTRDYVQDTGENLYRRSIYTFWKRKAPPPNLEVFNAPTREICTVRRERTNTPLQALVTLNDPQFIEAARRLAQNALNSGGGDDGKSVDFVAQRVLGRSLNDKELAVVATSKHQLLAYYQTKPEDATALITVGASKADERLDRAQLAAWTMICNQMLNLDEVLNK